MSDDNALGRSCGCFNRTTWVWLVAVGFLLYGVCNSLYYIMYAYVGFTSMTPKHCSGHRCDDILTCDATRDSSYNLRVCVLTIGSLVCGISAVNALANKYASDLYSFAMWLIAAGVLYLAVLVLDGAHMAICGNSYTYNTIAEALFWPLPNLPVNDGIKHEIKRLDAYPSNYVDALSYHNVFLWFAFLSVAKSMVFFYTANEAFHLAQRFHYGVAGMGATFSIGGWKENLELRNEIREVSYNTFAMAKTTWQDLGWQDDEFKQNLGGSAYPSAAAKAYDGFSDDRQNVLL